MEEPQGIALALCDQPNRPWNEKRRQVLEPV